MSPFQDDPPNTVGSDILPADTNIFNEVSQAIQELDAAGAVGDSDAEGDDTEPDILPSDTNIFNEVSQTIQELAGFGQVGPAPEPSEIPAIDPNESVPSDEFVGPPEPVEPTEVGPSDTPDVGPSDAPDVSDHGGGEDDGGGDGGGE